MGTEPPRSATAEALASFIRFNESIKQVVLSAFRINIMALNAILLTKRAGSIAVGFGVISNELRVLSVQLSQQMDHLSAESSQSVNLISDQLRQERRLHLLQKANAQTAKEPLHNILQQRRQLMVQRTQQVALIHKLLRAQLEETLRLCQFGTVISRSAKIEASYGGQFSTALSEVSQQFDQQIQSILPTIEALCREMQSR